MGFGQGVSGLNAAAQNLDVIGNNIANANTVGFKAASTTFADVYASSRVGLGVQVSGVNERFTVGNIKATGGQLDIAIDGAKGLFRLTEPSGAIVYSRNGQFSADKNNYIVNAQGQRLTGYAGEPGTTTLGPLKVPVGNIAPKATSAATTKTNLPANSPIISAVDIPERLGQITLTPTGGTAKPPAFYKTSSTGTITWTDAAGNSVPPPPNGTYTSGGDKPVQLSGGQIVSGSFDTRSPDEAYIAPVVGRPFSPADSHSYTDALHINVYDSLGNSHEMTQYFIKRAGDAATPSAWDVHYTLDGASVDSPAGGGPLKMTFDLAGRMTSPALTTIVINNPGLAGAGAEPLSINLDYTGTTQFGGNFTPSYTQSGYSTGEYAGMSFSSNGDIIASYTNGETQLVGVVALADFKNLQGLQSVGGNAWVETAESGTPLVGRPGANSMAILKGNALEESNVDLSQELVDLMQAQRNYQANAQTIKTQDQILQTLITMR